MSRRLLSAAIAFILLSLPGCENNFSPTGDFHKEMVVYGVLSNRSDSQFVRVYTTYNLSSFNPSEQTTDTGVAGATVTLTDDSTTYRFVETTFPRDDTARYSSRIVGYVSYPCRLRTGKRYSLAVISDQGNASATVSVPGDGYLYNYPLAIFQDPRLTREDIPVTVGISSDAKGYLVRLFMDFQVLDGTLPAHRRIEVPFYGDSLMTPGKYGYPTLQRRPANRAYTDLNFIFAHDAYIGVLKKQIEARYGKLFRLTSATFTLSQVESNLYNYYSIVNGFGDPYSIRTDQPDFTNIVGGVGVFGAIVQDSVVVNLQ